MYGMAEAGKRRRPGLARRRPTLVHHRDLVREMANEREVVCDAGSVNPRVRWRSCNRLITCACTDTSSAVTGSSQIKKSGSTASARASVRCRWPPEHSCG